MKVIVQEMNKKRASFRKKAFFAFAGLSLLCAAFYGFFVGNTIFNVVARAAAEKKISSISANIAVLESEYMKAENEITFDFAKSKGFSEISADSFVYKNPPKDLSMVNNHN